VQSSNCSSLGGLVGNPADGLPAVHWSRIPGREVRAGTWYGLRRSWPLGSRAEPTALPPGPEDGPWQARREHRTRSAFGRPSTTGPGDHGAWGWSDSSNKNTPLPAFWPSNCR
jgi:hypothetical protein